MGGRMQIRLGSMLSCLGRGPSVPVEAQGNIGLLRSGRRRPAVRAPGTVFWEQTGELRTYNLSEKRGKKTNTPRVKEAHGRSYTTSSSLTFARCARVGRNGVARLQDVHASRAPWPLGLRRRCRQHSASRAPWSRAVRHIYPTHIRFDQIPPPPPPPSYRTHVRLPVLPRQTFQAVVITYTYSTGTSTLFVHPYVLLNASPDPAGAAFASY